VFIVEENVRETIIGLFRQKRQMKNLGEDEAFFDLGVSSLTIIELQIAVEGALGVTVPTSDLMRLGTMGGWVEAYSTKVRQRAAVSAVSA
jgi:acyl carrier protein